MIPLIDKIVAVRCKCATVLRRTLGTIHTMPQFDDRLNTNKRLLGLRANEEENLASELSQQYGLRYINLRGTTINPEALFVVPEDAAR